MAHLVLRAVARRGGVRRIAASLALALAAMQAVHAAPILSVGARETVYSASQRRALGLSFWPDGNIGVAPAGNGQIHFYAANGFDPVRTTGSLSNPGTSRQSVTIAGAGGFNYLAGGPVYADATSGARLMLYHAEEHIGSAQNYASSLGLAVSRDPAGLYFEDLGVILKTNLSSPVSYSLDMGGGSLSVLNGELLVHYRDYMAGGGSAELAVAKAPLAAVMANALNRQGTAFTKYYNGAWSQPGLGGLASPLEAGNPSNAWSSVAYNSYLNQLVMVSSQWASGNSSDLYLSTSADGVAWTPRRAIAADAGEQMYPSLIGTGPDPTQTDQSFYVYYTDSGAGGWNRWNDASLARRQITFDAAAATSPTQQAIQWTSVGGYAADYQTGAPAAGWNYLWNPTGQAGNAAAYAPLTWSDVAGAYNTTGGATQSWSGGAGHPDDYLSLAAWGGHPGRPGYNAIASYTIQADDGAGAYRLTNSAIMKNDGILSPGEDGLNLLVYVNNTQRGALQSISTTGAAFNFNRDLGTLAVGDTVFVMANAAANQMYDGFNGFDFTIQKAVIGGATAPTLQLPPPPEWAAIGDFKADFQTGAPQAGWNYLWNPTGKLGNSSAFAALKWSDVAGAYNTTGAATPAWSGGKGHPDDYLTLAALGGHPGQPGYNAIVSYTIQADDGAGLYRLAASTLMKADAVKTGGEDGVTLAVYVNNALRGSTMTAPTTGAAINFDRDLGQLSVGDVIYVVLGAGANQNYDSFKNLNFVIQKLMPAVTLMASAVPEPAAAALLAWGVAGVAARTRFRKTVGVWPI